MQPFNYFSLGTALDGEIDVVHALVLSIECKIQKLEKKNGFP